MALLHDNVRITKKWLCRCHPKSSWFYYITTLASQKIISSFHYDVGIKEIYLPQVPVKSSHKVARKVITNKLPHIFIISLPYFKTCIYTPFHTGLRASFPKGVRDRWGGSAQVPSNHHQTTSNWAPKCCHHIHHYITTTRQVCSQTAVAVSTPAVAIASPSIAVATSPAVAVVGGIF